MNNQPTPSASAQTDADLPESNTLGGTASTGAGPDGEQEAAPSETLGLGHDDLDKADDVARRLNERNREKGDAE